MIKRVFKIIQATVEHQVHKSRATPLRDEFFSESTNTTSNKGSSAKQPGNPKNSYEQQLIDDLAHFGLQPPSSLKEVTAARNREMLKFHPDKFAAHPEKADVANEIAQMYNAAFERLKLHYKKQA